MRWFLIFHFALYLNEGFNIPFLFLFFFNNNPRSISFQYNINWFESILEIFTIINQYHHEL